MDGQEVLLFSVQIACSYSPMVGVPATWVRGRYRSHHSRWIDSLCGERGLVGSRDDVVCDGGVSKNKGVSLWAHRPSIYTMSCLLPNGVLVNGSKYGALNAVRPLSD